MNLPQWIRAKPPAARALARDPSLWGPLLSWDAALADAEDDGSAAAFVQRGGLATVEWEGARITYVTRFTEDGAIRSVEVWKIARMAAEGS